MKNLRLEILGFILAIISLIFMIIGFNKASSTEDNIIIICLLLYGTIYNYLYREELKKSKK